MVLWRRARLRVVISTTCLSSVEWKETHYDFVRLSKILSCCKLQETPIWVDRCIIINTIRTQVCKKYNCNRAKFTTPLLIESYSLQLISYTWHGHNCESPILYQVMISSVNYYIFRTDNQSCFISELEISIDPYLYTHIETSNKRYQQIYVPLILLQNCMPTARVLIRTIVCRQHWCILVCPGTFC